MKRGYFISALLILFSIQLITAQNRIIEETIFIMDQALSSIFAPIFGVGTSSEFLFAKILLFFLLFAVVFTSIKKVKTFEDNVPVQTIITLVFSIFAVRYMGETEIMRAILLPYSVFGVAVAVFLPLLIYFFFINTANLGAIGRLFAWFIYGAFFVVMWYFRFYEGTRPLGIANWVYIIAFIFVAANIIFNHHIHSYFEMGKHNKVKRDMLKGIYVDYLEKARKAREAQQDSIAEDFERKAKRIAKKF